MLDINAYTVSSAAAFPCIDLAPAPDMPFTNRLLPLGLCFSIFIAALLAISAPAQARNDIPAVQLSPITVPGVRKSGTRQMMSVTLFLELVDSADIEPVCRQSLHLKEAALAVFGAAQLPIRRGKLELGTIDQTLKHRFNGLFDTVPVHAVHIVQGQRRIGTGTGQKLGRALGCSRVPGFDPQTLY